MIGPGFFTKVFDDVFTFLIGIGIAIGLALAGLGWGLYWVFTNVTIGWK
jgi:hypothetical protein